MNGLDCIVIGYNDVPLARLVDKHKPFKDHSGVYGELKTNSVLLGGERRDYMELLNHVITKTHGVNPNLNAFEVPNLGAVYLTNYLRRRGLSAELINFFNFEKGRLDDLLKHSVNAVAITTTYYVEDEPIREIVEFIRERQPETRIILGGPFVYNACAAYDAASQDLIFSAIGADIYVTDSQGEATLARILKSLRTQRDGGLPLIPNLVYAKGDSFCRTLRAEEENSLDENAIDWRVFDRGLFTPTTYMRTARSCPFKCAFCSYPAIAGDHTLAGLETIRHELRYLADSGLKYLIFVDDTLNVPLPRFKQICRMMIEEKFNLQWISFFRCSNADDECFDLMKESGCLGVYLGIESGDQQILKYMEKFADVIRYREGLRKLHERGILTFGSFIAGYPGETTQSIMNTYQFIEETSPTFFNVQLYFHNPIAPINRRREEFGIQGNHYSWRHNTMTWQEGAGWVEYLLRNVTSSIPLTLYGFSIWSIPYLLQNGFSIAQIIAFGQTARKMLVKGLDDAEVDYHAEEAEMANIFATWQGPIRRGDIAI
jgi:radical SAM PhpK family P-methyltransferase